MTTKSKQLIYLVIIVFVVFFALGFWYTKHVKKYRCSDFQTWDQANQVFILGAHNLDGDHDGIPCESLLPIHER